ncbi:hypothetical protein GCM10010302_17440 [Streptomyces polychromogenes]|uniref:Uncharacterized protein n=1 Tax=Streptomyces polychromogenes TaxID=67342 RepID=A0ABN0V8A7_9ACTN
MSEYTKPLVMGAIGVLIVLFGFTPDLGDGAKECAGHDMKPGDSCTTADGAYGYDDIAAKDAENRQNKKVILSSIGGAVILGALGVATHTGVEDLRYARSRRRTARHDAPIAVETARIKMRTDLNGMGAVPLSPAATNGHAQPSLLLTVFGVVSRETGGEHLTPGPRSPRSASGSRATATPARSSPAVAALPFTSPWPPPQTLPRSHWPRNW